jgi:hypothetical protein
VTTCTLDDPNAHPPSHHSWVGHDLQWVRFGDELPLFPQSKSQWSQDGNATSPS